LIYDFHRDRRGELLVGTGAGLLRFTIDAGSGRFVPIELEELRESTIFSISEDSTGRLWLGSSHGLVQYSPEKRQVRRYGRRDNFLSGELNRRAALRRRTGEMLFGGIEGLTQFDPDVVAGSRGNPPVVFTRWITMTADGPVATPITGAPHVRLEPDDRAFTVEFAELSFSPNPGRRYRYRLEGLNENWIEATDHVASYAAPPPGKYVFHVQAASGGDGEWSSPGASLTLDVIPPFWKTAWFRIALVLTAGLLIWLAHQWRLRQAVVAERLRLRISRDLHDEIGAGLSSIALLSDPGAGEGGSKGAERAQLKRIGESARDMVADLREIVWAIDPDADRTADVVARMRDVAANLLRDVRINFDVHATDGSGSIGMEVRRDLLLLYKEILHNVAKHSGATEVRIALHMDRGSIELTVADNGVGFSPNGSRAGTGLKSLSERAIRLGGELRLDSEPGRGTTVHFRGRRT
jgi:signal transduction histidine kinase